MYLYSTKNNVLLYFGFFTPFFRLRVDCTLFSTANGAKDENGLFTTGESHVEDRKLD